MEISEFVKHWLHPVCLIGSLAVWVLYAVWEGRREAQFYYLLWCPELSEKKNGVQWLKNHNLHPFFTIQRAYVYIFVVGIKCFSLIFLNDFYHNWELITLIISSFAVPAFVFPFFHDGAYYWQYNKLSKITYPEKWWSESTTSKALFEFGKMQRIITLLMAIGLVILEMVTLSINYGHGQ